MRSKLRQAPHEPISRYRYNRTGEDNGDAHLKRQVMGREAVVAVTDGRFDFGPWEQIFYRNSTAGAGSVSWSRSSESSTSLGAFLVPLIGFDLFQYLSYNLL